MSGFKKSAPSQFKILRYRSRRSGNTVPTAPSGRCLWAQCSADTVITSSTGSMFTNARINQLKAIVSDHKKESKVAFKTHMLLQWNQYVLTPFFMCNHKPICFISLLLVVIGGVNWGLVGLGGFLGQDLNVVNWLLGSWPAVEWIVYILVGLASLMLGIGACKNGDKCPCNG